MSLSLGVSWGCFEGERIGAKVGMEFSFETEDMILVSVS